MTNHEEKKKKTNKGEKHVEGTRGPEQDFGKKYERGKV